MQAPICGQGRTGQGRGTCGSSDQLRGPPLALSVQRSVCCTCGISQHRVAANAHRAPGEGEPGQLHTPMTKQAIVCRDGGTERTSKENYNVGSLRPNNRSKQLAVVESILNSLTY